MVEINLNAFNKLSAEEIKNKLGNYKNKQFGWRRIGDSINGCQIWTPNYFVDGGSISNLVTSYLYGDIKLKVGDKSQIEDLDVFNLVSLLYASKTPVSFYDSDNF